MNILICLYIRLVNKIAIIFHWNLIKIFRTDSLAEFDKQTQWDCHILEVLRGFGVKLFFSYLPVLLDLWTKYIFFSSDSVKIFSSTCIDFFHMLGFWHVWEGSWRPFFVQRKRLIIFQYKKISLPLLKGLLRATRLFLLLVLGLLA